MSILLTGFIAAIAMIFLMLKMDLRKLCGYDVLVDIGFTGLLAWMLAGTYSGMMSALVGGAIVSVFLYFTKRQLGYKRLAVVNHKLTWRTYNGKRQQSNSSNRNYNSAT
jgi:hypothetical protein